ncbi:sugar ABC transporter permease [Spongiactinospora sp. TRM90649]|uniref:sugar ABC transporter permease n=1 Tax=Spongiactinospora sp. TRM90649 TaxID=3031114 RepID=UPI0023F72222|nr:sugar ABC transporter permease [Spongiactinospora sp. TRM90649]MDF5753610.1 sugar ABC transporter permease [Spongiactinospora sp. TRM90649]
MTTTDTGRTPPPGRSVRGRDAVRAVSDRATRAGRRLRGGDLGAFPVVIGLAMIWTTFQTLDSSFLTAANLTNLMLQVASVGMISVGIVMVLLLGEVDLSVGSVSGLCAAIMAVLNIKLGMAAELAVLAALAGGLAVGVVQGFFVARFGVPSFVATLAGLIAWQGLQLQLLGSTGTINLSPGFITRLVTTFLPGWASWALVATVILCYGTSQFVESARRTRDGLWARPAPAVLARTALLAGSLLLVTAILNGHRGVPLAVVIFIGCVVLFDLILRHTRYGRSVFAIGGNAEAARRAGLRVNRIRMSVFAIAGLMAAAGGVLAGARLFAVNQSSGSGDILLNAIAAAVIGGTSLFGGRGSAYSALLGVLVIGSVSNGIDLIGLGAPIKLMITGAVLLTAVTIDALARRSRRATGRG